MPPSTTLLFVLLAVTLLRAPALPSAAAHHAAALPAANLTGERIFDPVAASAALDTSAAETSDETLLVSVATKQEPSNATSVDEAPHLHSTSAASNASRASISPPRAEVAQAETSSELRRWSERAEGSAGKLSDVNWRNASEFDTLGNDLDALEDLGELDEWEAEGEYWDEDEEEEELEYEGEWQDGEEESGDESDQEEGEDESEWWRDVEAAEWEDTEGEGKWEQDEAEGEDTEAEEDSMEEGYNEDDELESGDLESWENESAAESSWQTRADDLDSATMSSANRRDANRNTNSSTSSSSSSGGESAKVLLSSPWPRNTTARLETEAESLRRELRSISRAKRRPAAKRRPVRKPSGRRRPAAKKGGRGRGAGARRKAGSGRGRKGGVRTARSVKPAATRYRKSTAGKPRSPVKRRVAVRKGARKGTRKGVRVNRSSRGRGKGRARGSGKRTSVRSAGAAPRKKSPNAWANKKQVDCPYTRKGFGQNLYRCAVGYAKRARVTGGLGKPVYIVRSSADYVSVPKYGTLRWALQWLRRGCYIRFATSMTIRLNARLFVPSHTSIDGRGAWVKIIGSLDVVNVTNVIIHNIEVQNEVGNHDLIHIRSSWRVWVDHCNVKNGPRGTVDVVRGSTDVTISNCYVHNRDLTMLLGAADWDSIDKRMRVTVYRNWFDQSGQRLPHCRWGQFHVVNNLYTNWGFYCLGGRAYANVRSERNAFLPGRRKEVTPWFGVLALSTPGFDNSPTIVSVHDALMNGATFHQFKGSKQPFSPPYLIPMLTPNTKSAQLFLAKNAGPQLKPPILPCSGKRFCA